MKKLKNELVSLGIYLVLFSVLGFISYKLFYAFCVKQTIGMIGKAIIITIIMGLNILALYGVNYIVKNIPRIYFIINGILINVVLAFVYVYYMVIQGEHCKMIANKCVEAIEGEITLKVILVFSIFYSVIYLIMFKFANMSRKPVDFSPKKK